jgi:hypothetical protein
VASSSNESSESEVARLLTQCCEELVASLPRDAFPATDPATAADVVSFIDLGGADVRATVAARATVSFLRESHPRRHRRMTDEDIVGWASEIVNQAAGRFVNKLSGHGISAQIGIPGSLMGRQLSLTLGARAREVFARDGLVVTLSLDELRRPLQTVASDDATRQEGDLLLF